MTRIVALLSWYDEDPIWLTRCITSLHKIPVDHLIALDGPYELYGGPPQSHTSQKWAVRKAAAQAGLTCEVHHGGWTGNEIEKRNHLFHLAEQHTTPGDWYLIVDADEFVTQAPDDTRTRLEHSPFDVAAVTLREPGHPLGTIVYPTHPKLFRAIRGLRAVGDHFTYTTPDGRLLWGNAKTHRLEPRQDLTCLVVEHHSQLRHPDRRQAAKDYYDARDQAGIEDLPAQRSLLKDPA